MFPAGPDWKARGGGSASLVETKNTPVAHLPSRFPAAVLPALLEAGIPVSPDDAVVQPCAINEAHGIFRICTRVVSGTAEG